ncbi:unnamed protein product [Dibothriocephalus latus]|uniref:FHA domain-containing protein n=1 Tax=Dibothriocephalus latus TaxID=60516 RepID=A0A3P7NWG6_DIBLA|nr:unnamed protein product [Dibothriocephalus latus]
MTSEQTRASEGPSAATTGWGLLTCNESGESTVLSKDYFTIGSGSENDLLLSSPHISDTHFALSRDPDGKAWLFNLSQDGVVLNGKSVTDDACELHHGDIISTPKTEGTRSTDVFTFLLPNGDQENAQGVKEKEQNEDECRKRTSIPVEEAEAPPSLPAKRPNMSKKASVDLCDLLTCSICDEIMYDCWRTVDNICPLCRCNILDYNKNHQLSCIIDEYVKHHPESQKSAEEKEVIRRSLESLEPQLPTANDTAADVSPLNSSGGSVNRPQQSVHLLPVPWIR